MPGVGGRSLRSAPAVLLLSAELQVVGQTPETPEEASAVERAGLFARSFALTRREKELLGHLLEGLDTRGVAEVMFLSEYTVQDHLKAIFGKVGVRSRRALVSRALGV
jgi:DNA-binding NarL/FixJ family response regulator